MALTKAEIRKATARRKYSDGRGLFLSVSANGRKTWAFCYRIPDLSRPSGYREREMGLGSIDDVEVETARLEAAKLRALVKEGRDPLGEKDAAHASSHRRKVGSTFREVAMRYIDKKRPRWTDNGRSEEAWANSLANHVYPQIGDKHVADITMFDVRDVLEPIWLSHHVMAMRLQNRVAAIMTFAAVEGLRSEANPADRAKIVMLLPDAAHEEEHHKAMPYDELPAFMVDLRTELGVAPRALEFTILTGLRTGEVIGATWGEIDLDGATWTIPAHRMKGKKGKRKPEDHRVPLTSRAVELLRSLPREEDNPHVFISRRQKGRSLSNMAMLKLLKVDMERDVTVHGFRSAFRDWAAEETDHANIVVEKALAHAISSAVEAAYRRGDLFEKRRVLMDDWAKFLSGPVE